MQQLEFPDFINQIKFNSDGLVPVIAQQFDTGEVLMMAWMNDQALRETVETGRMCYFSRSRQCLWRKGETSGHVQKLIELRVDCDADTLLALIDQTGAACHTGNRSCFFRSLKKQPEKNKKREIIPLFHNIKGCSFYFVRPLGASVCGETVKETTAPLTKSGSS